MPRPKVTISPSAIKDAVFCVPKALTSSGYFSIQWLTVPRKKPYVVTVLEPKAAFAIELDFEQPSAREKRFSVNVASIGATHASCVRFRSRARALAGNSSKGVRCAI